MTSTSPDAVRRLVAENWNGLVLFARQWTHDAEDVVQESLVRLFQQSSAPNDRVAWLYRVVRNEAISRRRKQRSRGSREACVAVDDACFASLDDQIDAQRASEALRELPEELREVVVARLWGQMTFHQVAIACEVSVATAHRRFERALSQLRIHLEIKLEEPTKDEELRNT